MGQTSELAVASGQSEYRRSVSPLTDCVYSAKRISPARRQFAADSRSSPDCRQGSLGEARGGRERRPSPRKTLPEEDPP